MAALLAATMETAKLFCALTHPDPTNIGIAAVAVRAAQTLLGRLFVRPHRAELAATAAERLSICHCPK